MLYRPEQQLFALRAEEVAMTSISTLDNDGACGVTANSTSLRFPWLRTLFIDNHSDFPFEQHHIPFSSENATTTTAAVVVEVQQQSNVLSCVVQRLVVRQPPAPILLTALQQYVETLPLLTALDLRGCSYWNVQSLLQSFAIGCQPQRLLRLYLPQHSTCPQVTLDCFTCLEELDVSGDISCTNVDFCAATLRVLYANFCDNLTDAGLEKATKLEVLHVRNCRKLTNVSPFAHSLLELNISCGMWGFCRIGSAELARCYRLQVLYGDNNAKIDTLRPFADRLRELHASTLVGGMKLDDRVLAEATQLVMLNGSGNPLVTTVAPFGSTLIELRASNTCGINDAGLTTATNLVCLNATGNPRIQSVVPFSSTLLELDVRKNSDSGGGPVPLACGIGDAALALATNIVRLFIS